MAVAYQAIGGRDEGSTDRPAVIAIDISIAHVVGPPAVVIHGDRLGQPFRSVAASSDLAIAD